jgi:hypothetical protein
MPSNAHGRQLDGADRPAGTSIAGQRRDTRKTLEKQASQLRLRRQQLVRCVYRFGSRAVFELIDELDRYHGLGADLDRRLERYAQIDPVALAVPGGDRFPVLPTRLIGGAP